MLSLTDAIISNFPIIFVGVIVGVLIGVLTYYFGSLLADEGMKARGKSKILSSVAVLILIFLVFLLDYTYATVFVSLYGIGVPSPGIHINLAYVSMFKVVDLLWRAIKHAMLADMVITFFLGMMLVSNFHIRVSDAVLLVSQAFPGLGQLFGTLLAIVTSLSPLNYDVANISMNLTPFAGVDTAWELFFNAYRLTLIMFGVALFRKFLLDILPSIVYMFAPLSLFLMGSGILRRTGATVFSLLLSLYFIFPLMILFSDVALFSSEYFPAANLKIKMIEKTDLTDLDTFLFVTRNTQISDVDVQQADLENAEEAYVESLEALDEILNEGGGPQFNVMPLFSPAVATGITIFIGNLANFIATLLARRISIAANIVGIIATTILTILSVVPLQIPGGEEWLRQYGLSWLAGDIFFIPGMVLKTVIWVAIWLGEISFKVFLAFIIEIVGLITGFRMLAEWLEGDPLLYGLHRLI